MTGKAETITASECARATGTTVRALRHYEKLGLVAPVRAANGYRHYGAEEVARVAAIRLMQRLGLRLEDIGRALAAGGVDLGHLLAAQEKALTAERRRLDTALGHTRRARALMGRHPDLTLSEVLEIVEKSAMSKLPKALKGLEMPELTAAQRADLNSREFTAADQAEVSARWEKVFGDAEALAGTDPKSKPARAMALEARALIEWFSGGDSGLENHAGSMWKKAWADPERAAQMPISRQGWDFLQAAMAALTD